MASLRAGLRSLAHRLETLTPADVFGILFTFAFLVRVLGVFVTHQYRDLTRFELERVAISLASTGVFGNPYAIPTGPTAHVSPGYPLILAAIFRLFGTGVPAEMLKQTLACAITAFQCAIMPALARALLLDPRAGLLAGAVAALLPLKFSTETMGDWETSWVALFLMLLTVLTVRLWNRREFSAREAMVLGAAWGVSLLFVSAVMYLMAAFLVTGLFFAWRRSAGRYLRFCIIQIVIAGLFLAPWAIRNQSALGAPLLTRSNLGLELRLSNNDFAGPVEGVNYENGVYHRFHPLQNAAEALKVRQMGEIAYNRECMAQARAWIDSHPGQFIRLSLGRFRWFWFFADKHVLKAAYLYLTRILGFAGLVYVLRTQPVSGLALVLILVIFPLPNYLVHVNLRHSYPIDWILTLTMSALLIFLWQKARPSPAPVFPPGLPQRVPAAF